MAAVFPLKTIAPLVWSGVEQTTGSDATIEMNPLVFLSFSNGSKIYFEFYNPGHGSR